MSQTSSIPNHVGYILDGNRRWAKQHGLPTYEGHLAGYNALKDVVEATADAGVKYISFYTFSTENWKRAASEVNGLMMLIRGLFKNDLRELQRKGFRLVVMGSREGIPKDIARMIEDAEASSSAGERATLVMCFNYGGQQEIVRAIKRAAASGVDLDAIDNDDVLQFLDHPEVPACDLIVRSSGEQRLSNFMLWRAAYSELLFIDKFWPEVTKADVAVILKEYSNRKRRFGE